MKASTKALKKRTIRTPRTKNRIPRMMAIAVNQTEKNIH